MRRRVIFTLLMIMMLLSACDQPNLHLRAGLRSSHYGIDPFPQPAWWLDATGSMAERFADAVPAVVWIVGTVNKEDCWLNFPAPQGSAAGDFKHIVFSPLDDNEAYLEQFDKSGVRVWLQVEPGTADVKQLISLILDRYGEHASVIGVGVDIEWYRQTECHEGCAVSDQDARAWVAQVRRYGDDRQLFLKHWLSEKLPPTAREGMVFLDDSQGFADLDEMTTEYAQWGKHFAPAPVGFQFGYEADQSWWDTYDDPPQAIGHALIAAVPNLSDLYWVDFTAYELWPPQ